MEGQKNINTSRVQGVREGTMDRKFNFQESQTLGTGLKGIYKNLAVSGQPWVLNMNDVMGNHAKSRGIRAITKT